MKRALVLFAALLATTAFAQKTSEDEAGDVSEVDKDASGPLKDRIRPVSGHLFLMDGRFEISPEVGVSFRDAFWQKVSFGAAFTYHFTESIAVSARGTYNVSLISGNAQICSPTGGGCAAPTREELTTNTNGDTANVAYGLIGLLANLDLQWAPLYGKLSLFSEKVLNFNMYGLIGPSFLMYGPSQQFTVGGHVGIGFRFFINNWLAIRLEVRDVIYFEEGYKQLAPQRDSLRNQLMADVGFSMFFPTIFKEEN